MKRTIVTILILISFEARSQNVTTFAGGGANLGDSILASSAFIYDPSGCAFDKIGNLYIACSLDNKVRKIDTLGYITTIAGTGTSGYNGDNIIATSAELSNPNDVALDSAGNIYIVEGGNNRVRKVDCNTGIITTVVGNGIASYNGDNQPAINACLNDPQTICFDKFGNFYIGDYGNIRVRKVAPNGTITTFAGTGNAGYSGDGGLADTSKVNIVTGLCSDTAGNILISDQGNSRIFKVSTLGIISTVAGSGNGYLYNATDVPATEANINPVLIKIDNANNLYISDYHNFRVWEVDDNDTIRTIAGNGIEGYDGDGGPAKSAEFNYPTGLAFDKCGNLYIADNGNNRIRKVTFNPNCTDTTGTDTTGSDTTSAVKSISRTSTLSIYPNPAYNALTVSSNGLINNISIINLLGQTVFKQGYIGKNKEELNITTLTPGIYFIKVNDSYVQKLLKE